MYNKVILIGNLTRDVELRYLPSGSAVAKFGLATNRTWKDQQGQQKDETCFIDITLFGRSAEVANQYVRKGSKILVEGRLVFEQWTDQQGQKRSKHGVVADQMKMLDTRQSQGGGSDDYGYSQEPQQSYSKPEQPSYQAPRQPQQPPINQGGGNNLPEIDINDDEIPF